MKKISELIEELQKLKEELGDVLITVNIDGFGGHASYSVTGVRESALSVYDFDENEYAAKEFFPDESIEEMVTVEIKTGAMIYST